MMEEESLESVEQDTISFYNKPIITVTLADGRRGVVLRWICEGLEIDTSAQVRRLKRSPTTKEDVWSVRVETDGGRQTMPTINFTSAAYWLAIINPLNFPEGERRDNIVRFQRECMDTLYKHFEQKALTSHAIITSQSLPQPTEPTIGSSHDAWIAYHQEMSEWHRWQRDLEAWQSRTDANVTNLQRRMDRQEGLTQFVPELLAHYRQRPLSDGHRATVKAMVHRLAELTGRPINGVWLDLNMAFHVTEYKNISDAQWDEVWKYLSSRIQSAGGKVGDLHEQGNLF